KLGEPISVSPTIKPAALATVISAEPAVVLPVVAVVSPGALRMPKVEGESISGLEAVIVYETPLAVSAAATRLLFVMTGGSLILIVNCLRSLTGQLDIVSGVVAPLVAVSVTKDCPADDGCGVPVI